MIIPVNWDYFKNQPMREVFAAECRATGAFPIWIRQYRQSIKPILGIVSRETGKPIKGQGGLLTLENELVIQPTRIRREYQRYWDTIPHNLVQLPDSPVAGYYRTCRLSVNMPEGTEAYNIPPERLAKFNSDLQSMLQVFPVHEVEG